MNLLTHRTTLQQWNNDYNRLLTLRYVNKHPIDLSHMNAQRQRIKYAFKILYYLTTHVQNCAPAFTLDIIHILNSFIYSHPLYIKDRQ